eukprot:1790195-Amphidinium_carterae.3
MENTMMDANTPVVTVCVDLVDDVLMAGEGPGLKKMLEELREREKREDSMTERQQLDQKRHLKPAKNEVGGLHSARRMAVGEYYRRVDAFVHTVLEQASPILVKGIPRKD